jgi:hypothetical protein
VTFQCDTDEDAAKFKMYQVKQGWQYQGNTSTYVPPQLDLLYGTQQYLDYIIEKKVPKVSKTLNPPAATYIFRGFDAPATGYTPGWALFSRPALPLIVQMSYHDCLSKSPTFDQANPNCAATLDWTNTRGAVAETKEGRKSGTDVTAFWISSKCSKFTDPKYVDNTNCP